MMLSCREYDRLIQRGCVSVDIINIYLGPRAHSAVQKSGVAEKIAVNVELRTQADAHRLDNWFERRMSEDDGM